MQFSRNLFMPVIVFEPKVHHDDRGSFQVAYNEMQYREAGLPILVQLNTIRSHLGVVRGLHYNTTGLQGKLVFSVVGSHWGVAVDVRKDSPLAGQWYGEFLTEFNHRQLWVPPGFAHGIVCLTDVGVAQYLSNVGYDPKNERSLAVDSDVDVRWPLPKQSMKAVERDLQCKTLKQFWDSYE